MSTHPEYSLSNSVELHDHSIQVEMLYCQAVLSSISYMSMCVHVCLPYILHSLLVVLAFNEVQVDENTGRLQLLIHGHRVTLLA